jgi:hypothetical protein
MTWSRRLDFASLVIVSESHHSLSCLPQTQYCHASGGLGTPFEHTQEYKCNEHKLQRSVVVILPTCGRLPVHSLGSLFKSTDRWSSFDIIFQ